jgi:anti-sigma regulatory factor (Ser/Thr protein kinase)
MTEPRTGDRVNELWESGLDDGTGDGSPRPDARADLVFSETCRAIPASVATLRTMVADFATKAGLPSSTIDRVTLSVSEAATNVVVHAYRDAPEPGLIHLDAELAAAELRVSIADTGRGLRSHHESPGLGLGLGLIAQLADNFELLRGDTGGLRVLMRFAVPAQPADS